VQNIFVKSQTDGCIETYETSKPGKVPNMENMEPNHLGSKRVSDDFRRVIFSLGLFARPKQPFLLKSTGIKIYLLDYNSM
jgi:hypothetical protein